MKTKIVIVLALALLAFINFSIWSYVNNPLQLQPWTKTTMGVTFNPMRKHDTQKNNSFPSEAEIEQDIILLSDKVHAIRTYSVLKGLYKVPELAAKHGLNITVGAWIDGDLEKNRQEIEALIQISRQNNPKIVRLMVGNEVMLRKDIPEEQLIEYLREVKKRTWRPVSTSETWDMWLAHPKLVNEVDFIGVHILPFWEGIAAEDAVDYIFSRYYQLQQAYPKKPIVITEVGWPSDGQPFKHATASISNQARFLREFLNRAAQEHLAYYIVEAFDQPWKMSIEGSAGAYWGIFNADRQAKYPMDDDVVTLPGWKHWATAAAVCSMVLMALFLFTRRSLKLPGILFFGLIANLAASTIFWSASIGAQQYQTKFTIAFWVILILMQVLAGIILLIESLEIVEVVWHKNSPRTFKPLTPTADFKYPKVSLHLPIHNEPPVMVRKTLEALAKVDYPNLEVLVMDNNTKDPAVWEPVRDDCERLGPMFRFFHLENWPGFKAGAINHALEQTASDAEIIAIIDSDYVLSPDWLKCLVPYFDNENVGFVQSPQDYRDLHLSFFKSFCYWEYAGFFNIGMMQRNEYNAIIQHGTMTMIRKSALLEVGKWAEWCICEDSELGLRLYEAGYDSVYVKDSFGRGLMPDTMSGYMTQRYRWVYGAMQIIKAHWRSFLPTKKSPLTPAQRYYFLAGWLPWFSDALALLFTLTSLALTALIISDPIHSELPVNAFLLPTIGLFTFKILRGLWLYQVRVPCSFWQSLGAALSGLSLTHTVAKGTIQGLFTTGKPFMRTPKYEKQSPLLAGLMIIWQELLLLILLGTGIWLMNSLDHFDNLSGRLWIAILSVQVVPYVATLVTLLISIAPNYRLRKADLSAEELDELTVVIDKKL
ncbi:Glycosyl transferase family 2 [Candidatus Methylobacter favarea]|uniref:Beta-monoglucosyldiacylglycerol synthase n=1 Tax=Candidatus Methylobacter favarea TaxID=2707345 RepID=A0A8S0WNQ2_9GAMM|nr:glycosyltransferase [Candidatus Methylobacter favarea]CAA9890505.1 Glycosyl transferase family 2 [Candidatus Methylobacter favarea]